MKIIAKLILIFTSMLFVGCSSLPSHDKASAGIALPKMVKIPSGQITMLTCPAGVGICPEHRFVERTVDISAFEIAETEVTMAQWDACVQDGGCLNESSTWAYKNRPIHPPCVEGEVCQYPYDMGWGRGNHPVIHVNWKDVQKYIQWVNKKTGGNYRLPTYEEWEYVAAAGSSTKYYWGDDIGKNNTNCNGCGSQWDGKSSAPVASFKPNPFGVYDMLGNVSEWVSTCLPIRKKGSQECGFYIYRGGAWSYHPQAVGPHYYNTAYGELRGAFVGFRLAR